MKGTGILASSTFGKFRLLAELGHGGMAEVFLAIVEGPKGFGFKKLTVVKKLRKNLAEDPEFIQMFVDEARIAARLNHPNVVQTNEVDTIDGEYYISMEYLDGQPLHRLQYKSKQAEKDGSAPMPKAAEYIVVLDMLSGLHHAHELRDFDGSPLGVVHRDVTPQNVFVTYDGQVKVVDFGIAKAAGRSQETREGIIKGKIRYMSLEQASGKELDRRADIFAAGVMLWEAATAQRLWRDKDDMGIVQALLTDDVPRSPKAVDPTVPDEIDRICVKALQKNREDRYADSEEFRLDLEKALTDLGLLFEGRKQLGSWIQETFADRREKTRAIIEKQLKSAEEAKNNQSHSYKLLAIKDDAPTSKSGTGARTYSETDETKQVDSGQYINVTSNSALLSPKKSRAPLFAALAIVGALGVGGGAYALKGTGTSGGPAIPTSTVPVEPQKLAMITLRVIASPSHAAIHVDGRRMGNPLDREFPKDGKKHVLRVEAPGFSTFEEDVVFDDNIKLEAPLAPLVQPTAAVTNVATTVKPGGVRPNGKSPHTTPATGTGSTTITTTQTAVTPAPSSSVKGLDRDDPWAKKP